MFDFNVDTHDPAVQASAARLIALLHNAYPEIEHIGDASPRIVIAAQGSLSAYLNALIQEESFDAEEYAVAKENETIASTIQLIDYIRGLPDIPAEDKKAIFEQMLEFATTHPDNNDKWDNNQKHWSTNAYFNPDNNCYEFSITSPAEALNLVCRALFDNDRHVLNECDSKETNLALRVETIHQYFLRERNIVKSGIRNKCAAGLQHDILYLLNNSFLDRPRGQDGKPIKLLMKKSAFLQESISLFLTELLIANPDENINRLLTDWQAWQQEDIDDECPLFVWLRNRFPMNDGIASDNPDAAWQTACRDYVKSRGLEFWLEIKDDDLSAFFVAIGDLPIPKENIDHCYLLEIMGKQQLILPLRNDKLKTLIELRNQVLDRFKAIYWRIEPSQIRLDIVFSLFDSVDCLYRYRDSSYILGETDGAFLSARRDLQSFLIHGFDMLNASGFNDIQINEAEFETLRKTYCEQEKHFLEQNHVDFITNFFAQFEHQNNQHPQIEFQAAFARYQQLKKDNDPIHPLIFSDQELVNLTREVVREGDTDVLNISPYVVNRLFLHGLMVPIAEWSDIYCHALSLVAGWLSTPAQPGQGLLNDFKQNYPHQFLFNLKLMSLLPKNARERFREHNFGDSYFVFAVINSIFIDYIILDYWENIEPRINWLIEKFEHLLTLLDCNNLTPQHSTKILTDVQERLGVLIQNADQLVFLLDGHSLDNEHRTQILTAVANQLPQWIHNTNQLLHVLNYHKLTEGHRTQILNAVGPRLGELFQFTEQLLDLLNCDKLSVGHRTQIWDTIKNNLDKLIYSSESLLDLLNCDKLTEDQRTQILDVIKNSLPQLLQYNAQSILKLLRCNNLIDSHRTQILDALKNQFLRWPNQALDFLNCDKLNENQRNQILDAIKNNLPRWIYNSESLLDLLSCNNLTDSNRTQILDLVKNQFPRWMPLSVLHLLNCDKLNEGHRTQILDAVRFDYFFIINVLQLNLFLNCDKLTEDHRTQILTAVQGKLGEMIQNANQLASLLQCDKLNDNQRTQILTAVQFGALIEDGDKLLALLNCYKLTEDHRTQILTAVQGKFGEFIKNANQLKALLMCPFLNIRQKRQILIGVQEGTLGEWINQNEALRKFVNSNILSSEMILTELKQLYFTSLSLQYRSDNDKKDEVKRNEKQLIEASEVIYEWINNNCRQTFLLIKDVIINLPLVLREAVGSRIVNLNKDSIINNLEGYKTNLTIIRAIANKCENYINTPNVVAEKKAIVDGFRKPLQVEEFRKKTTTELLLIDFKHSFSDQKRRELGKVRDPETSGLFGTIYGLLHKIAYHGLSVFFKPKGRQLANTIDDSLNAAVDIESVPTRVPKRNFVR